MTYNHIKWLQIVGLLLGIKTPVVAFATTFEIPQRGDLIGEIQTTTVEKGESLGDIGRRFDIGVYEMIEANPNLDPWVPIPGSIVVIPNQFILPTSPRKGIVLNLAEMRLYYYHADKPLVTTHPIGIGKKGWQTPLGKTRITGKKKHPPWYPPQSIRDEHLAKGDVLPTVIEGGISENPLGLYALYLDSKALSDKGTFLMHGTNRPAGIGVRGTHGCIRLLPEDIEPLFYQVPVGTPVLIIHEPYKVGWHNNHLYLEVHQPLSELQYASSKNPKRITMLIEKSINKTDSVNWESVKMATKSANGYPVRID